jgi:hypothetical protein
MSDRDGASGSRAQTSRLWRTRSSFERQQQRLQSRASAAAAAGPADPAAAASRRAAPAAGPSSATSAATAMLMATAAQPQPLTLGRVMAGAGLTPRHPAAAGSAAAAADCPPTADRSAAQTAAGGVAGLGGDPQTLRLWQAYEQQQASSSMRIAATAAAAGSNHEAEAAATASPPAAVCGHTQQNYAATFNTQKSGSDSHIGADGSSCSENQGGAHRSDSDSSRGGRGGGCLRMRLPDGHRICRVAMAATLTAADAEGRKTEFR